MSEMKNLTEQQAAFMRHVVLEGCSQTEAARRAGYADPAPRAYELVRKQHVMAAIREEQWRVIDGDLANVALQTLRDVMEGDSTPPAARVSTARTVLDIGGYMKRVDGDQHQDQPLAEMTRAELEEIVRAGKGRLTEVDKGSNLH